MLALRQVSAVIVHGVGLVSIIWMASGEQVGVMRATACRGCGQSASFSARQNRYRCTVHIYANWIEAYGVVCIIQISLK